MKKLLALILALIMVLSLAACAKVDTVDPEDTAPDVNDTAEADDTTKEEVKHAENIRVYALKGPTGMGMSKLMEDTANGNTDANYTFTIAGAPDEIKAEILKGNFDIAAVPTNLAAVLYSKVPETVRIAAVNTLGVLYIIENGETIKSIEDLNGKTIYATGQGSTPEYALNYILDAFGIDCTVEYYTEHSELATKMIAGDDKIGMLPVPNATTVLMQNKDTRIALDLTELWEQAVAKKGEESELCQGCIVVNQKFAEEYPEDLAAFLADYEGSVKYVNENPEEASAIIEKHGIIPKAPIAKAAIPDANIVYIDGEEMKTALDGFFKVLHSFAPASVGGQVPDEGIYYMGE
ncbi:MAG: ABC transporter substrate-binding protein [Ruminococcaceae bacterium]|nr:ABC transporter substrate-binding protein [Oscillospiraceae bacterium]